MVRAIGSDALGSGGGAAASIAQVLSLFGLLRGECRCQSSSARSPDYRCSLTDIEAGCCRDSLLAGGNEVSLDAMESGECISSIWLMCPGLLYPGALCGRAAAGGSRLWEGGFGKTCRFPREKPWKWVLRKVVLFIKLFMERVYGFPVKGVRY